MSQRAATNRNAASGRWVTGSLIVFGIVVGYGVRSFLGVSTEAERSLSGGPQDEGRPVSTGSTNDRLTESRVRSLEKRLSGMASELAALKGSAEARLPANMEIGMSDRAPSNQKMPPSPEESRRLHVERQAQMILAHNAESRDSKWADATEREIATAIGGIARDAGTGRLSAVDCREASCVAVLEWPSYEAATRDHSDFIAMNSMGDCAKHLLLEEPADRSGVYRAPLILSCERGVSSVR